MADFGIRSWITRTNAESDRNWHMLLLVLIQELGLVHAMLMESILPSVQSCYLQNDLNSMQSLAWYDYFSFFKLRWVDCHQLICFWVSWKHHYKASEQSLILPETKIGFRTTTAIVKLLCCFHINKNSSNKTTTRSIKEGELQQHQQQQRHEATTDMSIPNSVGVAEPPSTPS